MCNFLLTSFLFFYGRNAPNKFLGVGGRLKKNAFHAYTAQTQLGKYQSLRKHSTGALKRYHSRTHSRDAQNKRRQSKTMASDADACVPAVVTDFIFDLSDSITLSQLPEEQARLYNVAFRDLCSKVRVEYINILQ